MSPNVIYATMTGHLPQLPLYAISGFNVNVTNVSDGSLLNQTTINNRCGNNTCTVNVSELLLPHSLSYDCTTLRVTVTVVSDIYTESDPTEEDVMIFKRKFAHLRFVVLEYIIELLLYASNTLWLTSKQL